ncbi:MAG: ABC transporter permease [Candidatus Contendobacter sp.]|jgi:lipopolysaccharide transport system permease protein|nr:ABC transporter permease [Candidatus Contendobacter sp.]
MLNARYRDLILYKTLADLRAEAARTYIGFLWWVLDPLIFMAIFYVVFGLLLRRSTPDFVPFLLIGLVSWRWFQNTITHSATSILGGRSLMQQVYVPKIIFPLVIILTDLVKFGLVLMLLLIYLWLAGFSVGWTYLALPALLMTQFLLILGLTLSVAAVVPFVPDLKYLTEHALQILFYFSGIFFSGASIPENYQPYFYLNPMASIIEAHRDILIYQKWPNWLALALIAVLSMMISFLAYHWIKKNDHLYPKLARR